MKALFELSEVRYSYPQAHALAHISFEVSQGESLVVLGANASGKSTLLHLMDGLIFPQEGFVRAFGRELSEELLANSEFARRFRRDVGLLFQSAEAQLFCPSVREEIAFGPLQLDIPPAEVESRVQELSAALRLEALADRAPHELSGGEQKKVALASVLASGPSVLLLDEPTGGLDPRSQRWLVELLKELRSVGKTLVAATHDLSVVEEIADRVLVLTEDGRLAAQGDPTAILDDTELLLSANLIHEHVHIHGDVSHRHPHGHHLGHRHPH
jgi:cobalt/nickel transport system ATP-binding protein